ncbi:MAG TPA: outer membrane beta-barrel protein [Flavobacteriaceae bacterium]|nr:outer membrane beta-barrel protein [Flavobacteriaceae bacterium]
MNLSGKTSSILLVVFFMVFHAFSQSDNQKWKAQFAVGINHPFSEGFVEGFYAKSINFPTINLGIQYMFKPQFGAKLDFGYNRFSNEDDSPEFKVNYSRVNAQLVYDPTTVTNFLPDRIAIVGHAGPGMTFIKPLGDYPENDTSFLNFMAGVEFHYDVSQLFSVYTDVSYIFGFGKEFNPITDGYGSFNGDIITLTVGVSLSLSGCRTCF